MSSFSKEYYRGHPMAVNGQYTMNSAHMAGFLATVAGTITVTSATGTVVVNALPLAVGFNRIPLVFNTGEGTMVQLAGGAAGTLLL